MAQLKMMSKKTSPQSRPSRRQRTIRAGSKTQPYKKPAAASVAPASFLGRLRRYAPAIVVPNVVVVLGIVVVALAGLMLSATPLAGLSATIAQIWLILNLAPVHADGIIISVLPLLPTMGLIALIARRVRVAVRERISIVDLAVLAALTLAVPVLLTLIAAAMMWDAGRVFDVEAPSLGHAVGRTLLVHAIALVLGMGSRLWRAVLRRYRVPEGLVDAALVTVRIFTWLALASLVLMAVLFIASWPRQVELSNVYPSTGGVVAVSLVSLLYLPNAVISTITVLLGAEFHIGAASVSLFAVDLIALPPVPLLAIIPATVHEWGVALLLVTAGISAYVSGRARLNFAQSVGAGVVALIIAVVATALTSGVLGEFRSAGPMILLTAGLAFAWVAGVGVVAAGVDKLAQRRAPAEAPVVAKTEVEEEATSEADEVPKEIIEGEVVEDDSEDVEITADVESQPDKADEEEEVEEEEDRKSTEKD